MALEKGNSNVIKMHSSLSENDLLTHRINMEKLTILNGLLNSPNVSEETTIKLEQAVLKITNSWM